MTPGRDDPCVAPLRDTWGPFPGAATWRWSPRARPASDEASALNPWGADQLGLLFDALAPIARLRTARLGAPPEAPPPEPLEWTWSEGGAVPHAAFERALLAAVRAAPQPITTVELVFDLSVFFRTAAAADPARGWLRAGARGDLQLEWDDPYGALMVDHTLFCDGQRHGDSNRALHERNLPLLRDALARVEARLGPIVAVEGLPDVRPSGFAARSEP